MSKPSNAPLWVFIPNILVPETALERLSAGAQTQSFAGLPAGLLQTMARNAEPEYQNADGLDRIEAWLLCYLDSQASAKFEQYPAWAMMQNVAADDEPMPFTRFWGTVGCLEIERDGVRFTPPEVLQANESDLQAFWAVVQPLLAKHGWASNTPAGFHSLLSNPTPVPMEQASPWSVQGIRLTDYLPMTHECSDWRRMWLNMQVELHNAEFNQAREAKGLKPLNALWFWGGGEAWQTDVPLPRIKSVSEDGVFDAVKMTDDADEAVNRFVFWTQLLKPLQGSVAESGPKPDNVYCVNFQGWGGNIAVFKLLEGEVLQPMRLAGLAFNWVLLGNNGWKTLKSNWMNRFKFWQNKPNWAVLGEPEIQDGPSEEDLQAAWQQGQRDQDSIQAEWEGR
ncbi:hypothetical protein [Limnobacter parvus]|uniref:Uncharacterized protein n=1 Tax=Limnobacter parvus TaxID=2939690 RepID=A0ABT1XHX8_9BURK|nr:hypothetical protein [Limnobacter parvus]MCR2746491.1 hypothetical protein [Limnobacter parvus]